MVEVGTFAATDVLKISLTYPYLADLPLSARLSRPCLACLDKEET